LVFEFSEEAEAAVRDFVEAVNRKIEELGFKMSDARRRDILLGVEHSLRFFSFKQAKKRRSRVVEGNDAKKAAKHTSPAGLVKHSLGDPQTFLHVEKLRDKHFEALAKTLASSDVPRILDAGCGYGRQLMHYKRYGLRGEFFAVDVDEDVVRYGKSVEPSINFVRADIQGTLPFKDNVFDAVICIGVLHETRQRLGVQKAMQEFDRVLKSESLLYLMDAFTRSRIVAALAYFISAIIAGERYRLKSYIEKVLKEGKFTEINVEKVFSAPLIAGAVYSYTAWSRANEK
jgi:SAM-dependent methyltransferase